MNKLMENFLNGMKHEKEKRIAEIGKHITPGSEAITCDHFLL